MNHANHTKHLFCYLIFSWKKNPLKSRKGGPLQILNHNHKVLSITNAQNEYFNEPYMVLVVVVVMAVVIVMVMVVVFVVVVVVVLLVVV